MLEYFVGSDAQFQTIGACLQTIGAGYAEKSCVAGSSFHCNNTEDSSCSSPEFSPESDIYPAPINALPRITIHLAPGIYEERLVITRPNLTLVGDKADNSRVRICYACGAFEEMEDDTKRGTFRTAVLRVEASDFVMEHLTVENTAGPGHKAGQALALYSNADRAIYRNCQFLGYQDTIFLAPLPEKEFMPGGFRGPGEFRPRTIRRSYFESCQISGTIDFIFGGGIAFFQKCTLQCLELASAENFGYITAASTPSAATYGFVFQECSIKSKALPEHYYLGRPWREDAKTVFISCDLSQSIHPAGWLDWGKTHGKFYYAEYASIATQQPQTLTSEVKPADENPSLLLVREAHVHKDNSPLQDSAIKKRADFSHQLSLEDLSHYQLSKVLDGWNPQ